ncbi:MAG: HD domain-containing phosphohydrolase [Pseudomonadota bacterium]
MDQEESRKHTVLFVDDERNVLNSIERLLRKENFSVLTAESGPQGLEILARETVSVVVSDHRIPGMTGVEFLQLAKQQSPDSLRIMLTGYAETQAAMAAINEGGVYRFITKPWNDQELLLSIRDFVRQYELVMDNRRLFALTEEQNQQLREMNQSLDAKVEERTREIAEKNKELEQLYDKLEKSFFDSIRAFLSMIELFDPLLGGHSKRVAALASTMAARCGMDKPGQEFVEIAAILHDIGLIGLPREVLTKREDEMTQAELALFKQHPDLGTTALGGIDNLEKVAVLIRTHHENYGGTGFPHRLRGMDIPLGARIIHAASAYDDLVTRHRLNKASACEQIKVRSGNELDPEVVYHLLGVVRATEHTTRRETIVPLDKLESGMVLSRSLKTVGGRLLLPGKSVIRQTHIEKIKCFARIDPVEGGIYVFVPDA